MLGLENLQEQLGTSNDRKIKSIQPIVDKINSLEGHFEKLSDKDLIEKTSEFKERFKNGDTLDALLPEAFANCREAAKLPWIVCF